MLSNMTLARVIQLWFAAVALTVVASMAFGAPVKPGTAAVLLALSVVPPIILFLLWPEPQTRTAGEVLRGTERRR